MKKIELLAPAGDTECLIAAIQNGADAVYLGGHLFNARSHAKNFDKEQLKWAVSYAHLRGVKIYVTVNTLFKDNEFTDLIAYLDYLYDIQVDALIVQDIGLFDVIKKRYVDFEIHMSTQASIMNKEAVQYFQKQGATRVVLARENSIDEIRDICQSTPLEIEVFVHGAICVSYSGQCLMSSFIGKRSGNRGDCAQPCRLQYQLYEDGQLLKSDKPFILSPKDLMTIESVGELIAAGVSSFKIEGRMKRPEYVASVVKAYRKAIDTYQSQNTISLQSDIEIMTSVFNRDYTQGFLFQDKHFLKGDYSGNKGIIIGEVKGYHRQNKRVFIQLHQTLYQGDSLVFENIDKGRPVNKIYLRNQLVASAKPGDQVEIEFDHFVSSGHVRKTVDSQLMNALTQTYHKDFIKQEINMLFEAHLGQYPQLTITYQDVTIHQSSPVVVEPALKTALDKERIYQQLSKLGDYPFIMNTLNVDIDEDISLPIKVINAMRREAMEQLSHTLSMKKIHMATPQDIPHTLSKVQSREKPRVYVLTTNLNQLEIVLQSKHIDIVAFPYNKESEEAYYMCKKNTHTFALYIPRICKGKELEEIKKSKIYQKTEYIIVNDYGAYACFDDKYKIIGPSLNVYNSYAVNHYPEQCILSLEISQKEIQGLQCRQEQCLLQIYGKVEVMISEYCPISQSYFGYQKKDCHLCRSHQYALLDRKNLQFDMMLDEQCRMHLLNCHTLYINPSSIKNIGGYFIHFTNEDSETTAFVLNDLLKSIHFQKRSQLKERIPTTAGYYKT